MFGEVFKDERRVPEENEVCFGYVALAQIDLSLGARLVSLPTAAQAWSS